MSVLESGTEGREKAVGCPVYVSICGSTPLLHLGGPPRIAVPPLHLFLPLVSTRAQGTFVRLPVSIE